jgi:hypothetical protein
MAFYGSKVTIDPESAMLEELQRTVGICRWLEEMIGSWSTDLEPVDDEELLQGAAVSPQTGLPMLIAVHSTERALGFTDTEQAAWLKVYQTERAHLGRIAKACRDAGVQERMAAMLEARSDMMRAVLVAALRRAGLDESQAPVLLQQATDDLSNQLEGRTA